MRTRALPVAAAVLVVPALAVRAARCGTARGLEPSALLATPLAPPGPPDTELTGRPSRVTASTA